MSSVSASKSISKSNKKKTLKKKHTQSSYTKDHMVIIFLEMLNSVKLYHWNTSSFSQHKATDDLYSELNGHIDTFIETLLGKKGDRIPLPINTKIDLTSPHKKEELEHQINYFKQYLIQMNNVPYFAKKSNTDLLNIRDEILGDLNKFTYLLTLK